MSPLVHPIANVIALLSMPAFLIGIVNRVKSLWSGRKGPPLFQLAFDTVKLLRKSSVYSSTTTPVFRIAPYVVATTAIGSACVTPLLGSAPLVSFPFDFVWLAYVWGLGRVFIMLAALDTGSSFEGMGAAREATFSSLLEPALFLIFGARSLLTGKHTLYEALIPNVSNGPTFVVWIASFLALTILLQVETARMPVDDPTTHLELTMVHEVMVLDHSGPDLAAIQVGSAIKFFIGISMLAMLLNPWAGEESLRGIGSHLALCVLLASFIGTIESLVARFKLRAVPLYIFVSIASGVISLLATAWHSGGAP